MNSNWIKDMLQTLGIELDPPRSREDAELRKSRNMLEKMTKEKRSMENSFENLKTLSKINGGISGLIILFSFFNFSFVGVFAAIAYNIISSSFLKSRESIMKRRIKEWDNDILRLESSIQEQMSQVAAEKNTVGGTPFVEAEIIDEYPNQDKGGVEQEQQAKAAPEGRRATVQEAAESYRRLDSLEDTITSLDGYDHEMGMLFRNTYQSALKVGNLLKENPDFEPKMHLFYNNVETLADWADNLLALEKNDVYESLLVNVKNNARKALPVLQAKIDKEYFKLVNPRIMDLEAEMEVMAKEQY